jgi:U3 small nucleolar RNA-associated protein 25
MDHRNSITTRLITLLNVSATKIGKRKRAEEEFIPSEKLNKRKSAEPNATPSENKENDATNEDGIVPTENGEDVEMENEADAESNGSFQFKKIMGVS